MHALRAVPADVPDLRRDQTRAQPPARAHCAVRAIGEAQMRVMRELRRVLDPNGTLNPGKMFDL
jgi:FAD/FMN-containing dehydrogenase